MFLVVSLCVLASLCPRVTTYSRGAPDSACSDNMVPRHGYSVQAGPPPVEIITDMEEIVHKDYLRVTIRSKGSPFKGFLVKAVEALNTDTQSYASLKAIGTWYIPLRAEANTSRYVACGGIHQKAVTHAGITAPGLAAVHLQWSPPQTFHGIVVITASIVANYSTYWASVQSHPISVSLEESKTGQGTIQKIVVNATTIKPVHSEPEKTERGTFVTLGDYFHEFVSLENISTPRSEYQTESFLNPHIPEENLYSIVTQNITVLYKERRPRFEKQEHYEKIEAEYGAWENSGTQHNLRGIIAITCFIKGSLH